MIALHTAQYGASYTVALEVGAAGVPEPTSLGLLVWVGLGCWRGVGAETSKTEQTGAHGRSISSTKKRTVILLDWSQPVHVLRSDLQAFLLGTPAATTRLPHF